MKQLVFTPNNKHNLKRLVSKPNIYFIRTYLKPRWSFELDILLTEPRLYIRLTTNRIEIYTRLISNLLRFYTGLSSRTNVIFFFWIFFKNLKQKLFLKWQISLTKQRLNINPPKKGFDRFNSKPKQTFSKEE